MLSDKKFKSVEKTLGKETMSELEALSVDQLKDKLVAAESAIKQAVQEMEASETYIQLRESLGALTAGLKELKKRQNAIIQYSLSLLEDKGNQ